MAACEGFLQRHPENSGAMVAKIIPLGKIENLTWSDDFNRFVLSFNLRMGKHIGELLGETSGPIARFQAMAGDAVARCRNRLSEDQAQPAVVNALTLLRLTAWSIVFQDAGGCRASHNRLSLWLHGVCCARAP